MYNITYDMNEWLDALDVINSSNQNNFSQAKKFSELIKQSNVVKFMKSPTAINEVDETVTAISRSIPVNDVDDINKTLIDCLNEFEILYDIDEFPKVLRNELNPNTFEPTGKMVWGEYNLKFRGVLKHG